MIIFSESFELVIVSIPAPAVSSYCLLFNSSVNVLLPSLNKIEYNEGYEAIFDSLSYLYDKFNKYDMIEKYAQELEYIYIEYLLHASNLRFLKFNKLNNIKKVSIIMKEKYPNYRNNIYFKMENIKYRIVCNLFYKNKVKLLKLILK